MDKKGISMDERERLKKAYRMSLIAGICCVSVNLTMLTSLIRSELMEQNGWSYMKMTIPFSVGTVTGVIFSLFTGQIGDSKNCGKLAMGGAVLYALGVVILAKFGWSMAALILAIAVLWKLGPSPAQGGLTVAASKWYPRKLATKGTAYSTLGMSLSVLILTPLYHLFTEKMGYSNGLLTLGLILSAIYFIAASRFEAPDIQNESNDSGEESDTVRSAYDNYNVRQSLFTPQFWVLALASFILNCGHSVILGELNEIVKHCSGAEIEGWIFLCLGAIGGTSGRILLSHIGDKVGTFTAWATAFATYGIFIILFPHIGNAYIMLGLYLLLDASVNVCIVSSIAGPGYVFGRKHLGGISGTMSIVSAASGIVGPTIFAYFADRGNFTTPLLIIGCMELVGSVLIWYINNWYRKKTAKHPAIV